MKPRNKSKDPYAVFRYRISLPNDREDEAEEWLHANFRRKMFPYDETGRWARHFSAHNLFLFKIEDDAMLFKLTFGGQ